MFRIGYLTFVIVLTILTQVQSQDKVDFESISKIINNYRTNIFDRSSNEISELNVLFEKWAAKDLSPSRRDRMLLNILKYGRIDKLNYDEIRKKLNKFMPNSIVANEFTEIELNTIIRNADILSQSLFGALNSEFPFNVNISELLELEWLEYDWNNSTKIGELGSGLGQFSLLVHMGNPELEIYVNEIDEEFLKYQKDVIDNNENVFNASKFYFVEGNKKSTGLEGLMLDVIVVRNSFHHFSKREKMINSIRRSLRKNGKLYILESVPEYDINANICSKAISINELRMLWLNHDLKLVQETKIGEKVLFELQFLN